jgi:hypothetical protein
MRIEITAGGIYDSNGKEIPVGTELTVKEEPVAWSGRYRVVSSGKGKTAVTNPADGALKAEHHGGGKFNITKGEEVLLSGMTKADADAFNDLSDEDKAAFVADQKKA